MFRSPSRFFSRRGLGFKFSANLNLRTFSTSSPQSPCDPGSSESTVSPVTRDMDLVLRTYARNTPMPSLKDMHHFVNLTNGIEAIPTLQKLGLPYTFCRIQSTSCEQRNYGIILESLDPHMLTHLALGHPVCVWDLGCRTELGLPRSMWYGLEFIRYSLYRLWNKDKTVQAFTRGFDTSTTFEAYLRNDLTSSLERRLKYYAKLRKPSSSEQEAPPPIQIFGVYRYTENDPNFSFFVEALHREHFEEKLEDRSETAAVQLQQSSSELHPSEILEKEGFRMFVPGLTKVESRRIKEELGLVLERPKRKVSEGAAE